MDLGVAVVLVVGLSFVSILGVILGRTYLHNDRERHATLHWQARDDQYQIQRQEIERLKKSSENWQYRYKKLHRNYDIEIDEDEIDPDQNDEGKLSDIVKALYPKLPPSLSKVIDKPELQEALAKTAAKNPDGIASIIDRFVKPKADEKVPDPLAGAV